jgi:hypothetical protein
LLASRHGRRRVFSEWISEWNEFICVSSLVRCPSTDGWDRILDRRARCATSRAGKEHAVSDGGPRPCLATWFGGGPICTVSPRTL